MAVPVPKEVATALSSSLTATLVQNINDSNNHNNASGVLSDDNHMLRGDLPATKVTAKGLSPQQFQLIERLFKNSKNLTTASTETTTACNNGSPTTDPATTSISLNPNQRPSLDGKKIDSPLAASQSQGMSLKKAYEISAHLEKVRKHILICVAKR